MITIKMISIKKSELVIDIIRLVYLKFLIQLKRSIYIKGM